jgi:hypothetical protein
MGWASLFGRQLHDPGAGLVDTAADAPSEQSGSALDDQVRMRFRRPRPLLQLGQGCEIPVLSLHRLTTSFRPSASSDRHRRRRHERHACRTITVDGRRAQPGTSAGLGTGRTVAGRA